MAYNKSEKLRDNIAAIRTAFDVERSGREATEQEKTVLRRYSGFGGLKFILNPCSEDGDIERWSRSDRVHFAATRELYARIVDFARRHGILVVNDNPYSFILNDHPRSILSVPGARACCLELNSLSKAHNMSGWRIGMVAGDRELVAQVLKVKSQMDSGMFKPLQLAAVEALAQGPEWFRELNAGYARRRALAGAIFDTLGVRYDPASSGLFLWGRVAPDNPFAALTPDPGKTPGERVSDTLLYRAGIFLTPGFIFGKNGENYIRISLCAKEEVLKKARQIIETTCK